jgi:hypothetical protein
MFYDTFAFDHCGGSVQWNKEKTGYEPAFKTLNFGAMKSLGMGNKTNPRELLLSENILPMQAGSLILSKGPKVTFWSNQN